MTDFITAARAAREQRRRDFTDALRGRQPRDEAGRFKASTGFDGGARGTPFRPKPSPERDHNELVVELTSYSKLGRSGF
jgi:hypothetical protein